MTIKYFNLKKVEKQLVSGNQPSKTPGRRKFMKAMGLGAIAWNPVMNSISSITSKPFEIRYGRNSFKVVRYGVVAWKFEKQVFENGYLISVKKSGEAYLLSAKNLKIIHSNLYLDFEAEIKHSAGRWIMNISIPGLGIHQKINFLHFLDGIENIQCRKNINQEIFHLNYHNSIYANGQVKIHLTHDWQLLISGKKAITTTVSGKKFYEDELVLKPFIKNGMNLFQGIPQKAVHLSFPQSKSWGKLISNITSHGHKSFRVEKDTPCLNYIFGLDKHGEKIIASWVAEEDGSLVFNHGGEEANAFEFRKYIYLSEYSSGNQEFYLAAKLNGGSFWVSNKLGSFGFNGSVDEAELIASGQGMAITEEVFEPRLRAYKPIVIDAVTLTSTIQDPPKVRLSSTAARDTTRKQKSTRLNLNAATKNIRLPGKSTSRPPTTGTTRPQPEGRGKTKIPGINISIQKQRPVKAKTPKLSVNFDRVKFKPKKALNIKVLRPEDMLYLEFEFHNFAFSNKGDAPFVELDNPKKKGVVVVYFGTQHTLEEAFFESNQIPGTGTNTEVKLPVRHLRARKSRLVYELQVGHPGFPLILGEMLNWAKFELRVHPRAWIKLPQIKKIKRATYVMPKTTIPSQNSKYLNTPSKEYSIKLAGNTKVRASKQQVYDENLVGNILQPAKVSSVKSTFNTKTIKKISWKVGPIPPLSTSIEAPTLMYISPNQVNDFFHKSRLEFRDVEEQKNTIQTLSTDLRVFDPLLTSKGEVTELWHTRLGVKLKDGKTSGTTLANLKTIRALWAHDATSNYQDMGVINAPFMASLDAKDRQILVHTTSNYSISGYQPEPVPVRNLMLTNLGAYLDWHAFFDVPSPADNKLNIIEWEHLATLGRDHYVKVVMEGYLFPFGHRAALVKITERKFYKPAKAAVNRQRMYIVVLEKEVFYARNNPDGDFIEFPFQAVRIENSSTPDIDNPADSTLINVSGSSNLKKKTLSKFATNGGNSAYNFFINVGNKGYKFDLVLTDKDGTEHLIRMPLVFLENFVARDKTQAGKIINEYHKEKHKAYSKVDLFGQDIAYSESFVDGDTSFETEEILFGGVEYPAKGQADIKFHPAMRSAHVFIKQINEITGVREATEITLEDDDNDGQVFARVKGAVLDFSGGSDKSGGFLSPNMAISALSKLQGPVGGSVDDLKSMNFNPDDFFAALGDFPVAKIFGVINIFDLLLGGLDLSGSFDGVIGSVNQMKQDIDELKNEIMYLENQAMETLENLDGQIQNAKLQMASKVDELMSSLNENVPKIPNFKSYVTESAFYAEYKWQPEFKSNPIVIVNGLLQVNVDNPTTALTITTKLEKPFDADKPANMSGSARFEKFGVDIVPLLAVNFNYLEFKMGSSEKADVKVDIDKDNPIEFKGVLDFVNNLQSIIPSTGFSDDGPYIDLSPTGVKAGFDISIPNVEVGICMISNISLGASVTLPFTGAPLAIGFNFCKRENPFMLTISCFGGGGYFMMVTTLDGIQSIEAAFEFGAAMSLNVGVASGGVSAMGGFYYKMEIIEDERTTTLTGYLRINGHLSILGIISLSMEFYLAFIAVIVEGKVQKLEGIATVKVKIEVLFFSKTVSVTVRRELKGADADPKFIEMVEPDDWQEYCLAFAG